MKYRVTELPALKRRNNLLSQNFLLVIGNPLEISGIFFRVKVTRQPEAAKRRKAGEWVNGEKRNAKHTGLIIRRSNVGIICLNAAQTVKLRLIK
jgi:hypothetical protein